MAHALVQRIVPEAASLRIARRHDGRDGRASRAGVKATPIRNARWEWIVLLAAAAIKMVDLDVTMNSTVSMQDRMWNDGAALFDRAHHLSRAPTPDTVATGEIVASHRHAVFAERFDGSAQVAVVLGLTDAAAASSCSSPQGTVTESSAAASGSSPSTRKRRRTTCVRCDVCGDTLSTRLRRQDSSLPPVDDELPWTTIIYEY